MPLHPRNNKVSPVSCCSIPTSSHFFLFVCCVITCLLFYYFFVSLLWDALHSCSLVTAWLSTLCHSPPFLFIQMFMVMQLTKAVCKFIKFIAIQKLICIPKTLILKRHRPSLSSQGFFPKLHSLIPKYSPARENISIF